MLLATSGHIPLSPAKVVKDTPEREIPLSSNQGQKKKKFLCTGVLPTLFTLWWNAGEVAKLLFAQKATALE